MPDIAHSAFNNLGQDLNPQNPVMTRAMRTVTFVKKSRRLIDNVGEKHQSEIENLESNLITKSEHRLTKAEVVNVLINQHLKKYRRFVFTT